MIIGQPWILNEQIGMYYGLWWTIKGPELNSSSLWERYSWTNRHRHCATPTVTHRPADLIDQLSNTLHTTTIRLIKASQQTVVKSLRSKILTRADKGSPIVLLNRTDYDSKMHDCPNSINAQADPEFNFTAYNTKVRTSINGSQHLLSKEPIKKALLVPNPSPSPAYELPKLHKQGSSLRPVVSYTFSPTYLLAKISR